MSERMFRALGGTEEPIGRVDREVARTGYRVFEGSDGYEVAVTVDLIERAFVIGRTAFPKEWFGVLLGRVYDDEKGRHLVVCGLLYDNKAEASEGYVETSHASEAETRRLSERLFPDLIPVGWIHGHTGVGARFSEIDKATQRKWPREHSIGIVVDPFHATSIGVYRGPDAELLTPVAATSPPAPTTRVGASSTCVAAVRCETRPYEPPRRRARWPLIAAAATAVLVVGVLVGRGSRREQGELDALTRRAEAFEQRIHALEEERRHEHLPLTIEFCVPVEPQAAPRPDEREGRPPARPSARTTRTRGGTP